MPVSARTGGTTSTANSAPGGTTCAGRRRTAGDRGARRSQGVRTAVRHLEGRTWRSRRGGPDHLGGGRLLWPHARQPLANPRCGAARRLVLRRREARCVISAMVAAPGGAFRVFSTHFGLRARERRWQAARLADQVAQIGGPVLAVGDFNEWSWRGAVDRALHQSCPAGRGSAPTRPGDPRSRSTASTAGRQPCWGRAGPTWRPARHRIIWP